MFSKIKIIRALLSIFGITTCKNFGFFPLRFKNVSLNEILFFSSPDNFNMLIQKLFNIAVEDDAAVEDED